MNNEREHLSFQYGDTKITFTCSIRKNSNSKIAIKIHPDCNIMVAAPEDAKDEEIITAVKKRSRWIYRQLEYFRKQQEHLTPRKYISGESHYYLGKQYLLKIVESPDEMQGVKLLRGKLEVLVKQKSPEAVKNLLVTWYKNRARETFPKIMSDMLEQTLWVAERPSLRIQAMKTQWGSCSPNGVITLNYHLVKAPKQFIQYVILHELCHLAEHNHSERFYRLMQQVMPDWEKTKERLDKMAGSLL
ncbi:MAG: M48 family metallopeptidase [Legionellaceae bacterium]|nr:M48 family metallopeptidase [Legionellaceae bacterium]